MGLTAQQLDARTRSIGSSDAHVLAMVEGPGRRTPLQLWCEKRRGDQLQLPPISPPEEPDDKAAHYAQLVARASPLVVGNAFESSVVALYEDVTGNACRTSETCHHARAKYLHAHPDRVIGPGWDFGLECKMVGKWGASRWYGDTVPGYVVIQCQHCMLVTGRDRWDVAAWINGTDTLVQTVRRDDAICDGLHELARVFWHEHVLADIPPAAMDAADLRSFVALRYPKDDGQVVVAPEEAEALAMALEKVGRASAKLKEHYDRLIAELCTLVGKHKGIEGGWGRFTNASRAGSISWKSVAMELADGQVPVDMIEDNRGAPFRAPRLTITREKR